MSERDIFLAALDFSDARARAEFLKRVCGGDARLRTQVEALLESHASAGNFLAEPVIPAIDHQMAATLDRHAEPATDDDGPEEEPFAFLAPPNRPGSLGRLSHYEILNVLGRGGFGIVFRAFDDVLQRVVAVKVLSPKIAATSPARKRFLREARTSAQVRHENVVQVYAVEEQPLPYLVMEFIPGQNLQQRIDHTGPLDLAEIQLIGRQIAKGLDAAHARGLIHRDVKPGNVLIETGGQHRVKLTDFGLARAADDASITQSGLVAGTPLYMSPEQANGKALDHRADLFSLGSVLYTMASGRPPFRAANTLAVLKRVSEDTPRPIPEIVPEVPKWLCEIITKLHAKEPKDRFASAREVADMLARGADHGSREVLFLPSPRHQLRHRFMAIASVLLVLTLFGLGASEATGVTNVRETIIRLFDPDGTLVVEVDDPAASVTLEGKDLEIRGAGVKEIRLTPGQYKLKTTRDGKTVREELIRMEWGGRQVVRVSREENLSQGQGDLAAWEKIVAAMPAEDQVRAVADRLKKLNPLFDGVVLPTFENGAVTGLEFSSDRVADISPIRVLPKLSTLDCRGEGTRPWIDLRPVTAEGHGFTKADVERH